MMNDQADTLRKMMKKRTPLPSETDANEADSRKVSRVVFAGSGRGVGTSFLMSNITHLLNQHGVRIQGIEYREWLDRSSDENEIFSEDPIHYVLIMTPESRSLIENCRILRSMVSHGSPRRVFVIVNQVADAAEGRRVFLKLQGSVGILTQTELSYLGFCPRDEKIIEAVRKQKFLVELSERAPALDCMALIAQRLASSCALSDGKIQNSWFGRHKKRSRLYFFRNMTRLWKSWFSEVKA